MLDFKRENVCLSGYLHYAIDNTDLCICVTRIGNLSRDQYTMADTPCCVFSGALLEPVSVL